MHTYIYTQNLHFMDVLYDIMKENDPQNITIRRYDLVGVAVVSVEEIFHSGGEL